MICFACEHTPKNKWKIFINCSLSSSRVNVLSKLIKSGNQEFSADHADEIRINILAVLSELYAKEIEKDQNRESCRKTDKFSDLLDSLYDFLDTHYADRISVEYLAQMAGMSTCYLNRQFKRKFGLGVQEQIIATRMNVAKNMLKTGNHMIKQVAVKCGYDDPLYFSKAFKKHYGYPPSAYTNNPRH
jgi:AraC-like DNA-binding protein